MMNIKKEFIDEIVYSLIEGNDDTDEAIEYATEQAIKYNGITKEEAIEIVDSITMKEWEVIHERKINEAC